MTEFLGPIGFIFVILISTHRKTQVTREPLAIFFLISLGLLVFRETASDSGAALNPAVALSFSIYSAIFKNDINEMSSVWIYLVADFAGSIVACFLYYLFNSLIESDSAKSEYRDERRPLVASRV